MGRNKPVVAVSRMTTSEPADAELLARAEVRVVGEQDPAEQIKGAEGLIAIRPMTVTAELLEHADVLKVIASMGVGTDHIDVDAATERGIAVVTGAGVAAPVVAEYAIGAMLAGHRHFIRAHERLVAGDGWMDVKRACQGMSVSDAPLGIVGFGRIGRETARMAWSAFRCPILFFDPVIGDVATEFPAERVDDLVELCRRSLTVSVHTPLIPATRDLLGEEHLAAIGPDGLLVQASRGGVVNEDALVAALESGRLGGAAVDVYEAEPPDPSLIERLAATDRVLLTPHSASSTKRALHDLSWAAVTDVLEVIDGGRPDSIINRI